MTRSWVSGLAGVVLLGAVQVAQAREQFPGVIAETLGAPNDPPCSVCHLGGKTSGAMVATLFAWTMRAHGMSGSTTTVQTAGVTVLLIWLVRRRRPKSRNLSCSSRRR